MRTRSGHLRLVPRPLAKCEPYRYPQPTTDGVEIRRLGRGARCWLFIHTYNGRDVQTVMSSAELRDLVEQGRALLERNAGDVDE